MAKSPFTLSRPSNRLHDGWFVTFRSVSRSGNDASFAADARFASVSVQLQKLAKIELGLLKHFDFADVDIMKGVDTLASLLNVFADGIGDQLADNLCKILKREQLLNGSTK